MNESKLSQNQSVAQAMLRLHAGNPNIEDVKAMIKAKTDVIQKHVYHGMIGTAEEYLQVYGLTYHEEQHFNYLNQLLHTRTTDVLQRIQSSLVQVNSTLPPPPPPPPEVPKEIVDQVEQVLKNVDLPLSLFKRQDHYWSQDNAKTIQVREYIKDLHQKDRKWKGELKKKRQDILNSQNQQFHKETEENNKQEKKAKDQEKAKMKKKIEMLKSMGEVRKKTIDQGLEYIKQYGRPLYKRMQEQFHTLVELPGLQQKKRKLSQVRQLRKSVDLVQIQQHRQKHDKLRQQHQMVKILNQPVKVSFKGQFYRSLEESQAREPAGEGKIKDLYEKRQQFANMVKDKFKPHVSEEKAHQIADRIEQMNKRFTRAKKQTKKAAGEDEEQEDAQQEEEPQPQPEPEAQLEEDDQQDQQDRVPKAKDDQYQPSNQQRYKMGLKFLEQAKRKRKLKQKQSAQINLQISQNGVSRTKTARAISGLSTPSSLISPSNPTESLIPLSNDSSRRIKYRNYLHEMTKHNRTIDVLDTSQIRTDLTSDNKVKGNARVEELENKIRYVEGKAQQEEELLKYRKLRRNQAIDKKQELDKAMIDTIKARLALMNT